MAPRTCCAARSASLKRGPATAARRNCFATFGSMTQREEEGVKFFFDHEVDADDVREKFNEKRPVLSEIFKKRLRNKQKRSQPAKGSTKKKGSWQGPGGKVKRHSHKSKK